MPGLPSARPPASPPHPHHTARGSSLPTTALLGCRCEFAPPPSGSVSESWLTQLLCLAKYSIIHNAKWPLWFRLSFPSQGMPDAALPDPVNRPVLQAHKDCSARQKPPDWAPYGLEVLPSPLRIPSHEGKRMQQAVEGSSVKWSKRTGHSRDFWADFWGRKSVEQPTLAFGGHWRAPTFPHHTPKSGTDFFLLLVVPLWPQPHFCLSPVLHPETPMLGLSPFSSLPGGLVMAMCTKLLSVGDQHPAAQGVLGG